MKQHIKSNKQRDSSTDCSIQIDGSWQRRGYASHLFVVTAMAVDTGKCLDLEILSNTCKGCRHWEIKDKSSDEYAKWKLNHTCKINHVGSAGAIEPVGLAEYLRDQR